MQMKIDFPLSKIVYKANMQRENLNYWKIIMNKTCAAIKTPKHNSTAYWWLNIPKNKNKKTQFNFIAIHRIAEKENKND